jgi:hypothetical protein
MKLFFGILEELVEKPSRTPKSIHIQLHYIKLCSICIQPIHIRFYYFRQKEKEKIVCRYSAQFSLKYF